MSGRQLRSLGMALTLAAVLGFAGAQPGAAEAPHRVPARQVGVLERAWDWLAGWLGGQGGNQGLTPLWAAQGLGMDPNGGHSTAPPATTGDASFGLDPDGGRSTVTSDLGFGLDPNGGH
jgi:hypothetical protein